MGAAPPRRETGGMNSHRTPQDMIFVPAVRKAEVVAPAASCVAVGKIARPESAYAGCGR
jgi:hypothetical protein